MYSALLYFCLIYIVILNYRNGDLNEQIEDLDERLTKLEKDAVKITFSEPPFTTYDDKIVFHPEVKKKSNPKQFPEIKSEEPFVKTRTKRKPKSVKDWEDNYDLGGHE